MRAMRGLVRSGVAAIGMLALASAAALSQAPHPPADDRGVAVTSDSQQGCAHLARQVGALQHAVVAPHQEADLLAMEGQHLCATGHIRIGVIRLRYALMHLLDLQAGR